MFLNCTVLKAQIISLFFTYFAGGSLYPIALFTDGFKLQDRISDSAILGLILLIVIQVIRIKIIGHNLQYSI